MLKDIPPNSRTGRYYIRGISRRRRYLELKETVRPAFGVQVDTKYVNHQ